MLCVFDSSHIRNMIWLRDDDFKKDINNSAGSLMSPLTTKAGTKTTTICVRIGFQRRVAGLSFQNSNRDGILGSFTLLICRETICSHPGHDGTNHPHL